MDWKKKIRKKAKNKIGIYTFLFTEKYLFFCRFHFRNFVRIKIFHFKWKLYIICFIWSKTRKRERRKEKKMKMEMISSVWLVNEPKILPKRCFLIVIALKNTDIINNIQLFRLKIPNGMNWNGECNKWTRESMRKRERKRGSKFYRPWIYVKINL